MIKAIGRSTFVPHTRDGLCLAHFNPKDIITESYKSGNKLQSSRLKLGTVPTEVVEDKVGDKLHGPQFILTEGDLLLPPNKFMEQLDSNVEEKSTEEIIDASVRKNPLSNRLSKEYSMDTNSDYEAKGSLNITKVPDEDVHLMESDCSNDYSTNTFNQSTINQTGVSNCDEVIDDCECNDIDLNFQYNIDVCVEEVSSCVEQMNSDQSISRNNCNEIISRSSQTYLAPRYTITDFKDKPKSLLHFTGLEDYNKFMLVLYSLGPGVYHLKYVRKHKGNLEIPDQFFLVLWKLRRYPSDLELAEHFNVSECAVGNIFTIWILFMKQTWSLLDDLWPSRELVDFYMPDTFKNFDKTTRLTVDGIEIKTDGSSDPTQKQSTFSHYKNSPTMKVLIGGTPGGLISYCSPAYSGSTSDRQIIERSDLFKKYKQGDTILADKGFLVQDLFAPYGVKIATQTPVATGSLPHQTVMKDRKLSRHRVHIERIIGLLKTFTILSKKLNHYYAPLTTEIVAVCVMLTNFKENIMNPRK